jgi:hypothetical protein
MRSSFSSRKAFYISLSPQDAEALSEIAMRHRRKPQDQAGLWIEQIVRGIMTSGGVEFDAPLPTMEPTLSRYRSYLSDEMLDALQPTLAPKEFADLVARTQVGERDEEPSSEEPSSEGESQASMRSFVPLSGEEPLLPHIGDVKGEFDPTRGVYRDLNLPLNAEHSPVGEDALSIDQVESSEGAGKL